MGLLAAESNFQVPTKRKFESDTFSWFRLLVTLCVGIAYFAGTLVLSPESSHSDMAL